MIESDKNKITELIDTYYTNQRQNMYESKNCKRTVMSTSNVYNRIEIAENIFNDLMIIADIDNCMKWEMQKNLNELREEAWSMFIEALESKRLFGEE